MATSLELAITAIRSGRKEEGRQLLNLLIQQNPNNEMAWLWMSSVVNSDEQRARCLYHVLAINPDNELARRGLQLLGIVVSDSRPVKVPRDSQPIPIQKPQPDGGEPTPWPIPPDPTKTQPLIQPPQPEQRARAIPTTPPHQTGPLEERRPFRIDPRAITQELPFTPLREPFAEPARRSPSAFTPRAEADKPAGDAPPPAPAPDQAGLQPGPNPQPQPPGSPPSPSEPAPLQNWGEQASAAPNAMGQVPATLAADTGSLPNPAAPPNQAVAAPPTQQSFGPGMAVNETRPSQPIWVAPSNVTQAMPQPAAPPTHQPPYSASGLNSNVTMGMPTHYLQPQNSLPGMPAIHSNATMGMPLPPQNEQMPQLAEPAPVMPMNGLGMAGYASYPFQQPFPQNPVFHSSSTMAMPTMTEAEARARLLASQQPLLPQVDPYAALRVAAQPDLDDYRAAHLSHSSKGSKKKAKEEDDEEVNLLAVIVFGSLSVTALGGMGMLVLLWFTSV